MEEPEKTRVLGNEQVAAATGVAVAAEATQMGGTVVCPVCSTVNPALETYCSECGFLLSSQPGTAADEADTGGCPFSLVDDRTGRRYSLRTGENLIGREGGDVLLVDSTVSRRHAVVTVSESGLTITDLGSTNGTRLDGAGIPANIPQAIRAGSLLQLGNVTLRLDGPDSGLPADVTQAMPPQAEQDTQPTAPVRTEPAGPAVAYLLAASGHGQDIVVYAGTMTIGRRPPSDHVIAEDPYVSGRHASITASDGKLEITDLGSTNGTFVNGQRLAPNTPIALAAGDEVAIGQGKYVVSMAPEESEAEDEAEAEAVSEALTEPTQEELMPDE